MLKKSVVILCTIFSLTACGIKRKDITPPQSFISNPSTIIVAKIAGGEKGDFYALGAQGLLDQAINKKSHSGIITKIQELSSEPIIESNYYAPYSAIYRNKKFKVQIIKDPLKDLAPSPIKDAEHAPYDFTYLKDKYKAKYALILQGSFGVSRNFHGFIPMGVPVGTASTRVYLVNLEDNTVIGEHGSYISEAADGKWNIPGYEALMEAAKSSLKKSLDQTYKVFAQ